MTDRRILGGRYELIERLGAGGMATVWRALDRSLGRHVAVKLLHPNLSQDAGFVERFRREARHAASLAHPNVVTVYDSGQDGETPFMVMELVEGPTLHRVLSDTGPLPVARTARIGVQMLRALDHAHRRGLVHRDVKPGNVMLAEDGSAKVTDFGVAKELEEAAHLTRTGTMLGTASYISPEQAAGHPATPASDIYAAGCVLYECLTGKPPFTAENIVAVALAHQRSPVPSLSARRPDVPQALENIVLRALAKDPRERFRTAGEMAAALANTGLGVAPDEAPTVVAGSSAAAATAVMRPDATRTQVLGGGRPPPRSVFPRAFGWAAVVLLGLAAIWLALMLFNVGTRVAPTPSPSPSPTATPTPTPAPTRRPTPSPTPEPTDSPTPDPTPTRTPRPPATPATPDLGGIFDESPSPTATP